MLTLSQGLEGKALCQMVCKGARGPEAIDAFSETALLRHRPGWLLAVSWYLDGDRVLFTLPESPKKTLRHLAEGMEKKAETGYQLLAQVMEVLCLTLDHYFLPQSPLLTPDLIFLDQDEGQAFPLKILCLPLAQDLILEGEGPDLMDWLAGTFQWESELADRLNRHYRQADYAGLLEEARALNQKLDPQASRAHEGPDSLQVRKEKKQDMAKTRFSLLEGLTSYLTGLGRRLWRGREAHSLHEITQEISSSPGQLPMARLSRGLPGTPEEAKDEKAYILTEEFIIGRDIRQADLCLDSFAVSRQHARILLKGDHYYLEDLGSRNGSRLDGMPLNRHKSYRLPSKCRISFAGEEFYFQSA